MLEFAPTASGGATKSKPHRRYAGENGAVAAGGGAGCGGGGGGGGCGGGGGGGCGGGGVGVGVGAVESRLARSEIPLGSWWDAVLSRNLPLKLMVVQLPKATIPTVNMLELPLPSSAAANAGGGGGGELSSVDLFTF
eukprot:XP_015581263.1 putative uncharacterized protein DDB_G0287183 [Ricinus communis]